MHLALLKIGFSRKMLLKKEKPVAFFSQHYRLIWFFYSNVKQFQIFKIAKFEFKETLHYHLWPKCTQLWPKVAKFLSPITEDNICFY